MTHQKVNLPSTNFSVLRNMWFLEKMLQGILAHEYIIVRSKFVGWSTLLLVHTTYFTFPIALHIIVVTYIYSETYCGADCLTVSYNCINFYHLLSNVGNHAGALDNPNYGQVNDFTGTLQ